MSKVIIHTDGASRGNGSENSIGAYGAFLETEVNGRHHIKRISGAYKNVTNNQMEILSVIKALEELNYPCEVEVYSDSRYVCDAINKNWLNGWVKKGWVTASKQPVKNKELWITLLELLNKHNVKFTWVKGHADNEGNIEADKLCNIAMDEYLKECN